MHAYEGLVVEYQGILYPASRKGNMLHTPSFIPEDEIKNVFYVTYCFCFRGLEGTALGTRDKKRLPICVDGFPDKSRLEGLDYSRFDKMTTLVNIDFDDCDKVYVHKRKFKDYGIYGEEQEILKTYEELMTYVTRNY